MATGTRGDRKRGKHRHSFFFFFLRNIHQRQVVTRSRENIVNSPLLFLRLFMSPGDASEESFRNVDGKSINLVIKNEKENKVATFIIHENDKINFPSEILKCVFLITCFFINRLVFVILIFCFIWHYRKLFTFKTDSLLVMEFVGVQIVSKRRFFGLDTTEFLPWNVIQDIFINEVIIEKRVLYYLTFLVENDNQGKSPVRLVPLFRNTRPEKKCLEHIYRQLAMFIKPDKKS